LPTVFNQRNPLVKMLTQFQLEVNNQLSFLFKDVQREYLSDEKSLKNYGKLFSAIGQFLVYSWLFNNIYEKVVGRRPQIDPIGIAFEFAEDISNSELKKSDAYSRLGKNIAQEIPFAGSFLGGGRLPISAALPDWENLGENIIKTSIGEIEKGEGLKRIGNELLPSALYIIPPFGGGQAKKTIEGLRAVNQGGEFTASTQGEKKLRYPVDQNLSNYIQGALFGRSSLPETEEYYDNNRRPLSEKQTQAAIQSGDIKGTYERLMKVRRIESLVNKMKSIAKDPDLSEEEKERRIEELKRQVEEIRAK
jgi:hypothetical protein